MKDKNGVEMKTGMVVQVSGAYFKRDNGLYFVRHSPGDPSWCGSDHCLYKISKAGKISKAKYSICFWPLVAFVNDRSKRAEARRWNEENASIEVKTIPNMSEVKAVFQVEASACSKEIERLSWDLGENAECVQRQKVTRDFYLGLAASM